MLGEVEGKEEGQGVAGREGKKGGMTGERR